MMRNIIETLSIKKMDNVSEVLKQYTIVIYGAGAVGKTLLNALENYEIVPYCYIDKEADEIKQINNIPVKKPEYLASISEKNVLIIIAINAEVIRKVKEVVYANIEQLIPWANVIDDGAKLAYDLNFLHCTNKFAHGEELDLVQCLDCSAESKHCTIYEDYLKRIAIIPEHRKIKHLSEKFDWFGCIMGQICTLRCKHCCEHVPYMKNKKFAKTDDILRDCKKIVDSCIFIRYIELIGGEPFLHPDFINVLKRLLELENVGYIKVFTNGTVVPSDELCDILRHKRIVVNFSNYEAQVVGELLSNIYQTKKKLDQYHISYIFSTSKLWTDWGGFKLRNKTDKQLRSDFRNCFCANCHRLYDGILYRCPHQYAGITLGEMDYIEGEYIRVNEMSCEDLAIALDNFEDLPYTDGCRRCDMPYNCPIVPAGLQLD